MAEIEEDDEIAGNRKRDPELLAIERCIRLLEGLEPAGAARAICYLTDRYGTTPLAQ